MDEARAILHVDMDAFYASVEQRDNPELRGRPVLVGRGVVTSPSYEARKFGCRSAMPTAQALRLCPDAIVVRGRHDRYAEASREVFAIFHDFTPIVEGLSIDEAFLDVTGSQRLLGDRIEIARSIKRRIREEVGITASVGVSWTKFLAKLASGLEKPDGLTVIAPDDIDGRVADLPIGRMWGVGPTTEAKLKRLGIATFRHLREADPDWLKRSLGDAGEHMRKLAEGIDPRRVRPGHGAKSIGNESTFGRLIGDRDEVRRRLLARIERVGERLRAKRFRAWTVTIKLRFGDFETITRSTTLPEPTDRTDLIWRTAAELFDAWARTSFRPVRLVGVSVSHLEGERWRQLDLFSDEDDESRRRLDRTADAIRTRFGRSSLQRGVPYSEQP